MTSNLASDEIAQYGLQLRREAEARAEQRVRPTAGLPPGGAPPPAGDDLEPRSECSLKL